MIYTVSDRETISSLSSSTGFTAAKITSVTGFNIYYAIVQAIDDAVRFTVDGTAPVADTTGTRLTKNSHTEVWGTDALVNFRAIDDGGTAKLEVIYMGVPK